MSSEPTRCIDLWEFPGAAAIIQCSSGVRYTNQVGGHACDHPEIEGVLHPLALGPGDSFLGAMGKRFTGDWSTLTEADADLIDAALSGNGHDYLSVDRSKLANSVEAWVHVRVSENTSRLRGFGNCEAILTWPNSD